MTLILCLDDNRGRMFNRRRQSRDRLLIAELLTHIGGRRLVVSPYSAPLFPADDPRIVVAGNPCAEAGGDDCVFLEDTDPPAALAGVSELILYHWNRVYPADKRFCEDVSGFRLAETTEFVGSSHEKITKEVWKP